MKSVIEKKGRIVQYERNPGDPISNVAQDNLLAELLTMPDRQVDTSNIPEWTEEMFKHAVRGRVLSASEGSGEPAAGCGCDRVTKEGRGWVPDAR